MNVGASSREFRLNQTSPANRRMQNQWLSMWKMKAAAWDGSRRHRWARASLLFRGVSSSDQSDRARLITWTEKYPVSSMFSEGWLTNRRYSAESTPHSAMRWRSSSSRRLASSPRSTAEKYGPWRAAFRQCWAHSRPSCWDILGNIKEKYYPKLEIL